ncbi:MAG: ATP-dependent RNA helicase HrpA [Magnetococcales bacterium]|nr:ATP-dependent RNA helicase HrpA [Magnetococcales bacterium]
MTKLLKMDPIARCMIRDRHSLRQRLKKLITTPDPVLQAKLAEEIARSQTERDNRLASIPKLNFPDDLPVAEHRQEIALAISKHPVTIVCGATGSGKTTQLPKICLELGLGSAGMVGVTQPRRIAARSIANYLRQDLISPIERLVGHKIRFNDHTAPETLIKVMTDGILLAEIQKDRFLNRYETILVDEAHERSLNIDFLLGCLKQILPRRPEFKVIISSATLDAEKFSRHFHNAPVIEVSGRTYPVETRYRPLMIENDSEENDLEEVEEQSMETAIIAAVEELSKPGMHGDILVFLPGEQQIREIGETLQKRMGVGTELLPLYARLPGAEQQRIFHPGPLRRVILATNVAETSITVPGVHYVIDTGLVRISRISDRMRIQRLPVEKTSQSSADQRQGRCGRLAEGICIRLYSEEDYQARPRFTDPEILRTPLDAVILQMKSMQLGEIARFPFVDPPTLPAIRYGTRFLEELGALTENGELTTVGKQLARFPLPPGLGRILLEGGKFGRLKEILVLVAAMCVPDPREEPRERRDTARQAHARHADAQSDFIATLNLWKFIQQGRESNPSNNGLRRFLKENFLSRMRVREWMDIHAQLEEMCLEMGMRPNETEATYAEIHQAVLPGLLGNAGCKNDGKEYTGVRDSHFWVHPSSGLYKKPPAWIVAGELVETSRLYARMCAKIEPEWLEAAAGTLCRRSYSQAHWEKHQGQVMALERVTLMGLLLIANRKVHFGPINPVESRQIFIQTALVEGHFHSSAPFFLHNQAMIAEVRELEHKFRRRDLLTHDADRYAFYDAQLPERIYTARQFHEWYAHARKKDLRLLYFDREDVLGIDGEAASGEQFPGHLVIDGQEFPLEYTFDPGGSNDGVNVRIPISLLNQLSPLPFEWLVPGLLQNKILALLKALPKTLRRPLVPLPQTAEWCISQLTKHTGSLKVTLSKLLKLREGVDIPLDHWKTESLLNHLRMNFLIVDDADTRILGQGRDLEELKSLHCPDARQRFLKAPKAGWERQGILRWDFGPLPEQLVLENDGVRIQGTPVLQDDGSSVSLRLLDDPIAAREVTRQGLKRLFMLQISPTINALKRQLVFSSEANMAYLTLKMQKQKNCASLTDQILSRTALQVFLPIDDERIHDQEGFQARLQAGQKQFTKEAQTLFALTQSILSEYVRVRKGISQAQPSVLKECVPDIQEQLAFLLPPDFVQVIPNPWLERVPIYLQAIRIRLERCSMDPIKDARKADEPRFFWQEYHKRLQRHAKEKLHDPELEILRWMVEEFRISLFAQELKTIQPVSIKRLTAQLQKTIG